jgi:hypothetical protein
MTLRFKVVVLFGLFILCSASVTVTNSAYNNVMGNLAVMLNFSSDTYLKDLNSSATSTMDPTFTVWFDNHISQSGITPIFLRSSLTQSLINPSQIAKLYDVLTLRFNVSSFSSSDNMVLFADSDSFLSSSPTSGLQSVWTFPLGSNVSSPNCTGQSLSIASSSQSLTATINESYRRLTAIFNVHAKSSLNLTLAGTVTSSTGNVYQLNPILSPVILLKANSKKKTLILFTFIRITNRSATYFAVKWPYYDRRRSKIRDRIITKCE